MPSPETISQGQHVMAVCNACRYCEGYCPVFPAMEKRVSFAKDDLSYLANLCHNCGECLYACQFAPPHEFGINVPRALAEIRLESYEEYAWPASFGGLFRRHGAVSSCLTAVGLGGVLLALSVVAGADVWPARPAGDFYAVFPHDVMVGLFGAVGGFALLALTIGVLRARRAFRPAKAGRYGRDDSRAPTGHDRNDSGVASGFSRTFNGRGIRDVLTLHHLHGSGQDCTDGEERRSPWRRWFHHLTFYGFALCFASTTVAAIYHVVFGWRAPYGYGSLPVVLGTLGGVGLLAGPAGLFALRRRRDVQLRDPAQEGFDGSFILMLFMTSATGLLLLALRDRPVMAPLLAVHLGFVLGLFLTLPYSKFVHGIYRTVALMVYAEEGRR